MTIQQMADAHVGHPEEIDEDSAITAQRESFKWGALRVLEKVEDILLQAMENKVNPSVALRDLIDELRGE